MRELDINKAFTLMEPGPVTLITTSDDNRSNIMTLSWHMVLGFDGRLAIMTGPWNYSYRALMKNRECVINIPGADLLEAAIGIGTSTGAKIDKFEKFGLTAVEASVVESPLIAECLASLECRIKERIPRYDMLILETVRAWVKPGYKHEKTVHYRGDGTFIIDGQALNYRTKMRSKLAPGV